MAISSIWLAFGYLYLKTGTRGLLRPLLVFPDGQSRFARPDEIKFTMSDTRLASLTPNSRPFGGGLLEIFDPGTTFVDNSVINIRAEIAGAPMTAAAKLYVRVLPEVHDEMPIFPNTMGVASRCPPPEYCFIGCVTNRSAVAQMRGGNLPDNWPESAWFTLNVNPINASGLGPPSGNVTYHELLHVYQRWQQHKEYKLGQISTYHLPWAATRQAKSFREAVLAGWQALGPPTDLALDINRRPITAHPEHPLEEDHLPGFERNPPTSDHDSWMEHFAGVLSGYYSNREDWMAGRGDYSQRTYQNFPDGRAGYYYSQPYPGVADWAVRNMPRTGPRNFVVLPPQPLCGSSGGVAGGLQIEESTCADAE